MTRQFEQNLAMLGHGAGFAYRVSNVVDPRLSGEVFVEAASYKELYKTAVSLLTRSQKFISEEEMLTNNCFTTKTEAIEADKRPVTKPISLLLAADFVLKVRDGFDKCINEIFVDVELPKKNLILNAMLFDRKVHSSNVDGHIVMPLEVVSEFFQHKFSKSEERAFGFDKLDKDGIMRTFDAMGLFPESLHRLAKDNTQFPARLVELNKDKLSIEEIAEIGTKLLKIKEEVKTPVLDRDGNATEEFEPLSKNPKQSESMKQIAEILKEKIKAEEKLAKTTGKLVPDEVAKAAELIRKVDPKYKTAAETAAEKAGKLSSVPSSTCQASGAEQVSVGRSVFKRAVDVVRSFVGRVSGHGAAAGGDIRGV